MNNCIMTSIIQFFLDIFKTIICQENAEFYKVEVSGLAFFISAQGLIQELKFVKYCIWIPAGTKTLFEISDNLLKSYIFFAKMNLFSI